METFRSLVVDKSDENFTVKIQSMVLEDLPESDVLIDVKYSSVNYKDGLAAHPNGKVVKSYPFIPGIDLAGIVISSNDPKIQNGDEVIVTSYELGVSHFGGFSEYARVPSDWIVPLPDGISLKESMIFGTAGFTAAQSIISIEKHGIKPEDGPILVAGASGGVGSMAVAILANKGYQVVASTGKKSEYDFLKKLGAAEVISRAELSPEKIRPLDKQKWAGAIDPVGGAILSYILSTTKYGGIVASCGVAAGSTLNTTVFPFILRGITHVGIDSVYYPMDKRRNLWARLAKDLKPHNLMDYISKEITLEELPYALPDILNSKNKGRTIVKT